jgi:8-oxo-dGTP diphosphatase
MGGGGSKGSISMRPRYAPRPRACVSAALFRNDSVLLVRRANPVAHGLWSLPGGRIEPGETARAAAEREVWEETGLSASLVGLVDVHDVVVRAQDGRVASHYVISVFFGRSGAGEPRGGGDAAAAEFVSLDELERRPLTPGAARIVHAAYARLLAAL